MIKRVIVKTKKIIKNVWMYIYSLFWKKSDGVVLFGSWMGHRYADTSRFLYQYLSKNKNKYNLDHVVWVTREKSIRDQLSKDGFECYMIGSSESTYFHKKARYHIISNFSNSTNDYDGDIDGKYSCRAIKINLWHGTMAMKGVGFAANDYLRKKIRHKLYYKIKEWNRLHLSIIRLIFDQPGGWDNCYYLSTTKKGTETLKSFFNLPTRNFLEIGNPRVCECYYHLPYEDFVLDKMAHYKYIVLYVPTFRRKDSTFDFFEALSLFENQLKSNDILWIQKPHQAAIIKSKTNDNDNILTLPSDFDLNVIMKKISLLITDYSSVVADAMYYKKRILFFVPDLNDYLENDRGLIVDINEIMCGPIVRKKEHLSECILNLLTSSFKPDNKYEKIRKEYWGEDSCFDEIWAKVIKYTNERRKPNGKR